MKKVINWYERTITVRDDSRVDRESLYIAYGKRAMDIVVSLLGLIFTLPIGLAIYLAIKWEDGGRVIYSQERIGLRGHPFKIYKFRTMRPAQEPLIPRLCREDENRLTKVGTFVRNHHLDEIPQLWNVLKGDLSVVGPRPERQYFIEQIERYDDRYSLLYGLRPGLFSMATLYNGYTDTIEKMLKRLRMDLEYMERVTLVYDLKIIILTLYALLSGRKF